MRISEVGMRNVSLDYVHTDGIPQSELRSVPVGFVIPQWIRAHLFDLRRQLRDRKCELAAHRRRQIDHLDAAALQSNLLQQVLCVFDSPSSVEITFQVMTFAFQSTCDQHAVRTVLEGAQHVQHIQFARAGQLDDLDGRRIL